MCFFEGATSMFSGRVSFKTGGALFSLMVFLLSASVFSMAPAGGGGNRAGGGGNMFNDMMFRNMGFMDKGTMRLMGKFQTISYLDERIAELVNQPDKRALYDELVEHRNALLSPSALGTVLARGLAGSQWEDVLYNKPIKNPVQGLVDGLTARGSQALGDVLGNRMKQTAEDVVGGAWDHVWGMIVDVWNIICSDLFHDGKEAFKQEFLDGLQKVIRQSFDDIERMMKDGLKDSLRGRDMTLRKFDFGSGQKDDDVIDDEKKEESNSSDENKIAYNAWEDLFVGYAAQFDRFIQEIERRSDYYDDDAMIVFYSQQIKKRLLDFSNVLLRVKSLHDLSVAFDSNKAIIPAIKKNIDNMFKRLQDEIKPRSYASKQPGVVDPFDRNANNKYGLNDYMYNHDSYTDDSPYSFNGNTY